METAAWCRVPGEFLMRQDVVESHGSQQHSRHSGQHYHTAGILEEKEEYVLIHL